MALRETRVENGLVRGIPCGWAGYTQYLGIPYAAPPVGELRWRAPQPAADWEGVRDCSRGSAICWQPTVGGEGSFYKREFYPVSEEKSEDCLYLNVWTPAQSTEEKLPVLFWIHGGGYRTGYGHSCHFDGEPFAKRGVILVTINYRLNVFGFMVHPELDAENEQGVSGNYGLLDQMFALEWVYRNIGAFGGDSEKITIAGQSAGAGSVQHLVSSPFMKTPIRGAIMQSGGGIRVLSRMNSNLKEAEAHTDLMAAFGVSSIEEARKIPAEELFRKAFACPGFPMGPVVDGAVVPESLSDIARKGGTKDIAYLIGFTGAEGLMAPSDREQVRKAMTAELGPEAAETYMADVPEDPEAFKAFAKDYTGEEMRVGIEAWGILQERFGRRPVYTYCFDRMLPGDDVGPFHASDLWYVFETFHRSWRPMTGKDFELSEACCSYWCNFVRNLDPNEAGLPRWEPMVKPGAFMELGEDIGMMEMPDRPRLAVRREAITKEV